MPVLKARIIMESVVEQYGAVQHIEQQQGGCEVLEREGTREKK